MMRAIVLLAFVGVAQAAFVSPASKALPVPLAAKKVEGHVQLSAEQQKTMHSGCVSACKPSPVESKCVTACEAAMYKCIDETGPNETPKDTDKCQGGVLTLYEETKGIEKKEEKKEAKTEGKKDAKKGEKKEEKKEEKKAKMFLQLVRDDDDDDAGMTEEEYNQDADGDAEQTEDDSGAMSEDEYSGSEQEGTEDDSGAMSEDEGNSDGEEGSEDDSGAMSEDDGNSDGEEGSEDDSGAMSEDDYNNGEDESFLQVQSSWKPEPCGELAPGVPCTKLYEHPQGSTFVTPCPVDAQTNVEACTAYFGEKSEADKCPQITCPKALGVTMKLTCGGGCCPTCWAPDHVIKLDRHTSVDDAAVVDPAPAAPTTCGGVKCFKLSCAAGFSEGFVNGDCCNSCVTGR